MELTGKCKDDFEKWYLKDMDIDEDEFFNGDTILSLFYSERESMQYGVYVDFFDSVGILIENGIVWEIESSSINIYEYNIKNQEGKMYLADGFCNTLVESWRESIEKSNEIYNN